MKDRLQFSILNSGKVIKQREKESWRKRRERVTRRPRAAGAAAVVCALAPGRILAFVKPRHGVRSLRLIPRILCLALPCLALLCLVLLCFTSRLLQLPSLLPYYSPWRIIGTTIAEQRESLSRLFLSFLRTSARRNP